MYPATVESFTLQYMLLWFSIGICYSMKVRNLSDEYFRSFFSGI
jgi:hypothetical protein